MDRDDASEAAGSLEFSADWFSRNIPSWRALIPKAVPAPRRILEIGSFEGRATTFMLAEVLPRDAAGEIHCVDSWAGGVEHAGIDMDAVLNRFRSNVGKVVKRLPQHKVVIHRGASVDGLLKLLGNGAAGAFDFAYVDGSHQAADVLQDLVLTFRLMRRGGLVICDDYIWQRPGMPSVDVLDTPKIAIDAFTTIYRQKIVLPDWPSSYQAAFIKRSD